MGVAVRATRVSVQGDEAYYDLVSDPADPPVRVGFRWVDDDIETDVDYEGAPVFVRAGIRGVAGRRAETGEWPERVTRQS